jgi:hypothetical protein
MTHTLLTLTLYTIALYTIQVIEMLVKFMDNTDNRDFVVCLAGYRNLMTKMLNANTNLMSRMGNWIDFPDYDDGKIKRHIE